jgi:hypothetical protein
MSSNPNVGYGRAGPNFMSQSTEPHPGQQPQRDKEQGYGSAQPRPSGQPANPTPSAGPGGERHPATR